MRLRLPKLAELASLSELCLRSKAHWGYSTDMIISCREELTILAADLAEDAIRVAEDNEGIVGLVQISVEPSDAILEKLFIEPCRMGRGVGRLLYEWACAEA